MTDQKKGATHMAVGIEDGKVLMRFPKEVSWLALAPDAAVGIGEKLIMCGVELGVHVEIPQPPRDITPMRKAALETRIAIVMKNLLERKVKLERIAKELTEIVLKEAL